jgi:hypothetical protein
MKTNQFFFAAFTAAAFFNVANYTAAQVTIGGTNPPAAGAILDLNSTTKGGLQLSNVSLTDPNTIPVGFPGINSPTDVTPEVKAKLTGAIVYNTHTSQLYVSQQNSIDMWEKGIYVWDGNQWNKIKPTYSITFAPYNLGADPAYNTPKKQIEYLASCSLADAFKVFGDYYQWGRVADGHEKRDAAIYGNTSSPCSVLDANGQVDIATLGGNPYDKNSTSQQYGHLINSVNSPRDWRTPQKDNLWGNGESRTGQTDNQGGVLYTDGKYYQNTDWAIPANNPCASMGAGWRVPTQDEWERLANYDWNPSINSGNIPLISSTGQANTSTNSAPLTWVPVANGKASTSWTTYPALQLGGYAVYKTADWQDAIDGGGYLNGVDWLDSGNTKRLYDADAPEPLLFLPAAGIHADAFYHRGIWGEYWSSTTNSPNVCYLRFMGDSSSQDDVEINVYNHRAMGMSVRCVKNN